ncbi:MAG: AzlC family ABC transporter permease [Enterocloster clostridioformis]
MKHNSHQFHCGLKDGVPIGLGYLAVSFTFGIMARGAGLTTLQSVVMSLTNLTSAGQLAALGIIQAGAPFMEMAMAPAHHQPALLSHVLLHCPRRLSADMPFFHRFFMSYGVTDEIFGVSVCRPGCPSPLLQLWADLRCRARLDPWHPAGSRFRRTASGAPHKRPERGAVSECSWLWRIPPAKTSRILTGVILASMALSLVFAHVPFLAGLSSGFKIILLTILIAGAAALLFPVKADNEHES